MPGTTAENPEIKNTPSIYPILVPFCRYNARILQFRVLQLKGYPVDIEETAPGVFPEGLYPNDREFQLNRIRFAKWAKLTLTNPDFEDWVETPNNPGYLIEAEEYSGYSLMGHPLEFVAKVCAGDADSVAKYLNAWDSKAGILELTPENEYLITKELLERCFVTAYEQDIKRREGATRFNSLAYELEPPLYESSNELYKNLRRNQKPVSPEELMEIIYDYYSLVEELAPEFNEFKKLT